MKKWDNENTFTNFHKLAACNLSTESVNIANKIIIEQHSFKGKKLPFMELLYTMAHVFYSDCDDVHQWNIDLMFNKGKQR